MRALTFVGPGRFSVIDRAQPVLPDPRDAIVRVTLSSICNSYLHILHGSMPQAQPEITVGHAMMGWRNLSPRMRTM